MLQAGLHDDRNCTHVSETGRVPCALWSNQTFNLVQEERQHCEHECMAPSAPKWTM